MRSPDEVPVGFSIPCIGHYCLLVLALLLCGCTSIDYRAGPVPGLTRMTVEEHVVSLTEVFEACYRCGHKSLEIPLACTCINFSTNHAVIWLAHGAPQWTIEHERAHARGYDHMDGELRSRYATWKLRGGNVAGAPPQSTLASHRE